MSMENSKKTTNSWIAIEEEVSFETFPFPEYSFRLGGQAKFPNGISVGDWVIFTHRDGTLTRVGMITRIRADLGGMSIYLDKEAKIEPEHDASTCGLTLPATGGMARLSWDVFEKAVTSATGKAISDIPPIKDQAYIRELLQLAIMDDLLGPANGPREKIVDMGVRDRYLVGKLAPQYDVSGYSGGIEGLEGPLESELELDEPVGLEIHTGHHETGAEFERSTGRVDADAEATEEIEAASNQSLVPSSLGMTFCVDGDVEAIEIEVLWGKYIREYDHEYRKPRSKKIDAGNGDVTDARQEDIKVKVWQRVPCGGKIALPLIDGILNPQKPDPDNPNVRIQGTVHNKSANGDRLVTLFIVNGQEEPKVNKDLAWVFQPEIIVRADKDAVESAVFRRRLAISSKGDDPERDALEMMYRRHVEFAVGHGVAVHAETDTTNVERSREVRTAVMPQYEVPQTETQGHRTEDRPEMKKMIAEGYLDMERLASMERGELVSALRIIVMDYTAWIGEQSKSIGIDVVGHDTQAEAALGRCDEVRKRLEEGISVLDNPSDGNTLKAFQFANRAMARQRIHSIYALARRRGETRDIADFNKRENRSWRPFQLGFLLLSLPSLSDPLHSDRTKPLEALADLLWFPTGGGKTEAYFGVAAFAMAVRRLQGNIGGFDGSRGLSVIMRYTLRLLTIQQFQRATTLICAMEELRQEAEVADDRSLGTIPFTIGLWVGNKVTPGSTKESNAAIRDIRNPDKYDEGNTSPAQLTSCPWCGTEIRDGHDIKVNLEQKRTIIYCGDKVGRCAFSEGQSSTKTHPGLPVVVVDEEIYHRPPSMIIATVDKFALMAWRGGVRTLFGRATKECPRHGLLWPDADCKGRHNAGNGLPKTDVRSIIPIRPPDLIIQDEFHLISGPLGTMVGLYETAVDELSTWNIENKVIKPKIIASTATVRKASEQVNNVFMRKVSVFPPHGLDIADNFFSIQRAVTQIPGRRYLGICSPGSSRPSTLIRVYTAFMTASQELLDRFGQVADPYMTGVGYFNSLRELGGMKRMAEDDVQTRSYRVNMSMVDRPGLAQRSVTNIDELTSRVSSRNISQKLDLLEVTFKADYDSPQDKFVTTWEKDEDRAIDLVLATNMLSVGVDVNRLGLMIVNGQPKTTAEYIQATSRVGRASPGLVCTVLTWARPRDLSHYETFEHYHATFYKHVEAQSVTPFSPRAIDRGLTGALVSVMRLEDEDFNPNFGARALDRTDNATAKHACDKIVERASLVTLESNVKTRATDELKSRIDKWCKEAGTGGRTLGYEKTGPDRGTVVALLKKPGIKAWDDFTAPMSMREVEPGVRLVMSKEKCDSGPNWAPPPRDQNDGDEET